VGFGLGFGALVGTLRYDGRDVPYIAFMVPGVAALTIMFRAFFENTYSSFVRMYYQKTFDAILATPLLVEDVIVGEILWGATKSMIDVGIMFAVIAGFGLMAWPSCLWLFPLTVVGGLLFASMGMITTALSPSIDSFNLPIFLVIFPMFMFSGTFLPLDNLPGWAAALASGLPLTHLSLLVRSAFLGWAPAGWGWSVLYLWTVTPLLFLAALHLMKRRLVR
jgi:lipooligosaccharide transport system permease protein